MQQFGEVRPVVCLKQKSCSLVSALTLKGDIQNLMVTNSIKPEQAFSMEIFLERADVALYKAKEKGRNCFHYFSFSKDQER